MTLAGPYVVSGALDCRWMHRVLVLDDFHKTCVWISWQESI